MKSTYKINHQTLNTQNSIKKLVVKRFKRISMLISITILLKSLVKSYVYTYLCGNSTHSASRKNSKWVFFFLDHSITHNTPPLPLFDAHLGGLFFFSKPVSLTQNTLR